ncbi:conserved hypothetical protein [Culex quinquefasciatus]|uniref:SoHo domain-containing protein n=1 Tax=Culex quinquefasciatus TaxID=7176 RepID=B0WJK4_CULQU|nr:conserved hypothetical protein [Culex quinquefasciatus]|eukprot:XP_001848888.1 conserved hypothetical protein [Culex quinquefasciatus]
MRRPLQQSVWSPHNRSTEVLTKAELAERSRSNNPDPPPQPVWTPRSAPPSPVAERREFRPIGFESPTPQRRNQCPTPTTPAPWTTSAGYEKPVEFSAKPNVSQVTTRPEPTSGAGELARGKAPPPLQNSNSLPTIGHTVRFAPQQQQQQLQSRQQAVPSPTINSLLKNKEMIVQGDEVKITDTYPGVGALANSDFIDLLTETAFDYERMQPFYVVLDHEIFEGPECYYASWRSLLQRPFRFMHSALVEAGLVNLWKRQWSSKMRSICNGRRPRMDIRHKRDLKFGDMQPAWLALAIGLCTKRNFYSKNFQSQKLIALRDIIHSLVGLISFSEGKKAKSFPKRLENDDGKIGQQLSTFESASNQSNVYQSSTSQRTTTNQQTSYQRSGSGTRLGRASEISQPVGRQVDYLSEPESTVDHQQQRSTPTMAQLSPRKVDGVGPMTREGMPLTLRSEVDENNQAKWYKKMYQTLHKAHDDGK